MVVIFASKILRQFYPILLSITHCVSAVIPSFISRFITLIFLSSWNFVESVSALLEPFQASQNFTRMPSQVEIDTDSDIITRHKKEMKEFQVKCSSMKKAVPVSDKKRRKELNTELEKLEKEMLTRHEAELAALKSTSSDEVQPHSANTADESDELCGRLSGINVTPAENQQESGDNLNGDDDDNSSETPGKKQSRAQRRRQNKQAKLTSTRVQNDQSSSTIPVSMSSRTIERIKVKKLLDDLGYRIVDIPSDGNCLYSALCHQLVLNGVSETVLKLRSATATFMRSHPDDFLPFLHHDSGEPFTEADFAEYCRLMGTTNAWGSQVELRAISRIFRWPVRVLQADGPAVFIGEEFVDDSRLPLTVVYLRHELTLGEHYNSVVPT